MSKSTPVTDPGHFAVASQVGWSVRILSRTGQPSYHTIVKPYVDDAATMDARISAFEKPKLQYQAAYSSTQRKTPRPSRFMNVSQSALCDLVNAEVVQQVADRFNSSIATAFKKGLMGAIQLTTDSMASQKMPTVNGLIDVSIPRII